MTPKSGKAGSIVAPAEPEEAIAADNAEAGKVAGTPDPEKTKRKQATLGSAEAPPPFRPSHEAVKTHWIEIELVDENGDPVAGEAYEITMPDGSVASGTLDNKGRARHENIPVEGTCKVTFPKLDKDAWEKA